MTALTLLILPFEWILAVMTAAAFHECCHIVALSICGVHIYGLYVGDRGTRIETGTMEQWQEFCCALAGPLGSMSLLLLRQWVPTISVCGLIQGVYNLLPVYPLDGGRIINSILGSNAAEKIGKWTVAIFVIWAGYIIIRIKLGAGNMILLLLLMQKLTSRKTPCKD